MSLPPWPPAVPYRPRRGEWSMQPYRPPLATEMDGGNVRQRARPGDNVATVDQVIRMSASEYDVFNSFLRATLNNGTSRFTGNVWLGTGYANRTMQFVEPPQPGVAAAGLKIPVSMKLRVYGV